MHFFDRRDFLHASAAALFTGTGRSEEPATGEFHPGLAPFDTLMTDFIRTNQVPGAALAVSRHSKLVYARGFGYADAEKKSPVHPAAMFRIASVSKPFTATAMMQLVEQKKLGLDDPVLKHVKLTPHLSAKSEMDPRWKKVTVRHCLQHTGGWDRDKPGGYDPIGIPGRIAKALNLPPNVPPNAIVCYMLGQPLDFEPGTKYVYSNLGYLVLGRIIEAVTGEKYEAHLKKHVLEPVGITRMSLARALSANRPKGEVAYSSKDTDLRPCLYPPKVGEKVHWPDGAENVESYEAHGGWVASAPDLLRFACAFDTPASSPLLKAESIRTMFARPEKPVGHDSKGKPLQSYYACGWSVVEVAPGKLNTFHTGYTAGVNSLLVRRFDGLNWAVLFNTEKNSKGEQLTGLIDGKLHEAADAVKKWPEGDLFGKVK
jgi:N-acyl-D-amino-acid deacylase